MTTPKQTPAQAAVTKALNKIPWASRVKWIAFDGLYCSWWTYNSKKPKPGSECFVDENADYDEIGAQKKIPYWPGDWRDSLHRVIHKDGKSRVEWVGRGK